MFRLPRAHKKPARLAGKQSLAESNKVGSMCIGAAAFAESRQQGRGNSGQGQC